LTATRSVSSSRVHSRPAARRGRAPVLLDTNALFLPVRTRFPLEAEVDRICPGASLWVPASVHDELDRLVAREVPGARVASELARRFPTLPSVGQGDAAILDAALRHRAWVVTADRALAERLRGHGISVLIPRDRQRLELLRGHRVAPAVPISAARRKPPRRRQRL